MVYNKKADELYVIGLLMGSCKYNRGLYKAMLLAPALRQMERLYSNHIIGRLQMIVGPIITNQRADMESHPEPTVNQLLPDLSKTTDGNDSHLDTGYTTQSLVASAPENGVTIPPKSNQE